jgi:hypothetical protein
MRVEYRDPPRKFRVGRTREIEISHCADVELASDQQITFTSARGSEYDVVRKDWGYYATPSLNGRLPDHGLRPVLVRDPGSGRAYLLLVEDGHEPAFERYVDDDGLELLCWLDTDERVATAAERLTRE